MADTDTQNLMSFMPEGKDADDLLMAFLSYAEQSGIELYEAQEEAILELFGGNCVVLNTPTGSGKSLVALAAHFYALANDECSVYTAPVKALVSEKFFDLCKEFGTENVGMLTGDASINADAPILCCTAEILANLALRDADKADIALVIMDEFHYYSDRDRGMAWQIPILTLPQSQFLIMSATLGETQFFVDEIAERTGRDTVLVRSTERPVPLNFEYRTTPLHESLQELLDTKRAPVYIVHFTQKSATDAAQNLTSINVLTKDEKQLIKDEVAGFSFDSPIGKDLRRFVLHGIGVHHAGLLPKYRLLVERLAKQGLLKVICGTDTLGVGVNVPIRTVLFTQLCKWDGRKTRVLTVRDFQQIAGRAGRKGFDDQGWVWVQAPEHAVENLKLETKAAQDPKKKRKFVKKKPPERGYAHWDERTLTKLSEGTPERLKSQFEVSHAMMLHLLDRPGDGCAAARKLMVDNHETRKDQRRHIRRSISIYRSLLDAEIIELLDEPDELGRRVRMHPELQDDFRLNQPLSPFLLEAVEALDVESGDYHLEVLSLVEAILDNPGVVLAAQLDRLRTETVNRLKSEGVEYDQRMDILEKLEYPKPLEEFLEAAFTLFGRHHPWVGQDYIRPKSIARDMLEQVMTFAQYINNYQLKRSEGVLLRYLSDVYKTLNQTIPEEAKTEELLGVQDWLGQLVRSVDSSLIEEWERLANPTEETAAVAPPEDLARVASLRALRVQCRGSAFRWVEQLAHRSYNALAQNLEDERWTAELLEAAMEPYWAEYSAILIDAEARGPSFFNLDDSKTPWQLTQIIADAEGDNTWRIVAEVDPEQGFSLLSIGPI